MENTQIPNSRPVEAATAASLAERPLLVLRPGEAKSVSMTGEIFTFMARGRDTGGAYALMEVTVAPNSGPPMHTHDQVEESFYILEGELDMRVGDQVVRAGAGTYVNVPRGAYHAWKNPGTTPTRIITLVVPAGMDDYFEAVGHPVAEKYAPPVMPNPTDIQRMLELGPQYGIIFSPPPAASPAPSAG